MTSIPLSDLISPEYQAEQKRLHDDPRGYGGRGSKWAEVVAGLIETTGAESVLDYGCGQGTLETATLKLMRPGRRMHWRNYDPALKELRELPKEPFDLVVCTDVLEHVEPEKIGAVLTHLRTLTRVELFTVISLVPTEKKLSDGRQAHILLRPIPWWVEVMEGAGFIPWRNGFPNPKPEKQWVQAWKPVTGAH